MSDGIRACYCGYQFRTLRDGAHTFRARIWSPTGTGCRCRTGGWPDERDLRVGLDADAVPGQVDLMPSPSGSRRGTAPGASRRGRSGAARVPACR